MTVAALYVERGGPYFTMPDVDPWGIERDARKYAGPHPVVAHPPCGPWGRFRNLANGHDKDCAPIAVNQVRSFGGVLEHPAYSALWSYADLPSPRDPDDSYGGFSLDLDQCAFGHVARKRTWLYVVGVDRIAATNEIRFGGEPTHVVERTRRGGTSNAKRLKLCSHQQRRRTPPAFAAWLVALASSAWTFGEP